jgi:dihydropteroate synthase
MGIVNVTPDSFSDGGAFATAEAAIAHGLRLVEEGADIIDVGGESTRPGAAPVTAAEELRRVLPVVTALARAGVRVSIDTMKPDVARAAVECGAVIWNDVNALRADGSLEAAVALDCAIILMHMRGEPRTMQTAPHYDDVVADVADFLSKRVAALEAAGVRHGIWVDPGIGFGKTLEHNLALLRAIPTLHARTARPVLIGASRKSFIGKIEVRDGGAASAEGERLGGSIAVALHAAAAGADMLRVHDVAATVQALRVARALEEMDE